MLDHLEPRPVTVGDRRAKLHLGRGPLALEVVIVAWDGRPRIADLRAMFRARSGRRAAPVLIVVPWGNGCAAVCGPTEHNPVEYRNLSADQVEAVCGKALEADGRHTAIRLLHRLLPALDAPIPGLRNGGLFAMQELERGVPSRGDWALAAEEARGVRTLRGRALIAGLGFATEELPGPAMLLLAGDRKTAVAVLLDRPEEIDAASPRFDGISPVSYALAQADRENLDWVVAVAGGTIRLYPAKPGVGTGRRGRAETFAEINLDLLSRDDVGYLWLLLSAPALSEGGSVEDILRASEDYAADLGGRLRERVYREVMPSLARAVVAAMHPDSPTTDDLQQAYQAALRILYRLLFVAYAEDRGLLPLHASRSYREHSLKRIAQRLGEARRKDIEFGDQPSFWSEVMQIWTAVSIGNPEWEVPAYNGTLFASEASVSKLGARIAALSLPDREFAGALAALLLDRTAERTEGPVDFRSLGIREFGTIYEGLLESELSLAETDLTVDARTEAYLPAKSGDTVEVRAGEVYLHNRSGARKSSGSYYTPAFAVEHLLDRALEPALDEHLERLEEMPDREAGRRFFEFRVADIAMGSGHFLVGAVDRIERRLANYLAARPLPDVREEFARLRRTAQHKLGPDWSGDNPIEDIQLLRRQVARRCIFGVDMNPMAVELARLSLWIHTFVPGLPLSLLDHNLIQGNSLVGIASFEEASELFQTESGDLFSFVASERLGAVREPLERLARLTDASNAEIREARELYAGMRRAIRSERELFTLLAASRTNSGIHEAIAEGRVATALDDPGDIFRAQLMDKGREELKGLDVLHFALAFPHVFLGRRNGFDVILGNPPWEKPRVEEDAFWARHFPGLSSQPQWKQEELKTGYRRERPDLAGRLQAERDAAASMRHLLTAGGFPGMGTGDPDLYKAFVWRFWDLVSRDGGRIGVVLPRSALAAKGSTAFRKELLASAEVLDVTMLVNNREWVFPNVHPQYTIGLTAITRGRGISESELRLNGPYANLKRFRAGVRRPPVTFRAREVEAWNDTASIPLLPSDESVEVFAQLRRSPRLDLNDGVGWRARPHRELDATNDKHVMDLDSNECPEGFWPVYKGASFDLWNPDTGTYYAWADPARVLGHLQSKRMRANRRSAFAEFDQAWRDDPKTQSCLNARIVFRRISRATDSRTIRAALVPPHVILTDVAPYFLWPRGNEKDEAYLLGVLSSVALDWYARRFVETHMDFHVLNPLPVPRSDEDNPLRKRVIALVGRLASPDDRFADWAGRLGVACGPMDTDEKQDHIRELDAVVAHLYGLAESQLVHIFETFHEGWDHEERLKGTLHHFQTWRGTR
ncbi:MAG: hypothetical protein F4235_02350 [Candidatus Dadabacteria bacterium]|nr:hypothetical protein [Candidatus Dadabacteria bacterium]